MEAGGQCCGRAFSSEVETGSRQENASNQKSRAPFRFHRNGKGSRLPKKRPENRPRSKRVAGLRGGYDERDRDRRWNRCELGQ
ncbi:hypothetical protein FFI89_000730 [Bradyrhizobium sp. KBS0727]|nr:hypothetical protein FFI71_000730 [Bradyrhizobium sp. KBS0725]QDW42393.1 hypothetical protein FFI89_000730 [Bradyrhizobium sp. KBS0727]